MNEVSFLRLDYSFESICKNSFDVFLLCCATHNGEPETHSEIEWKKVELIVYGRYKIIGKAQYILYTVSFCMEWKKVGLIVYGRYKSIGKAQYILYTISFRKKRKEVGLII